MTEMTTNKYYLLNVGDWYTVFVIYPDNKIERIYLQDDLRQAFQAILEHQNISLTTDVLSQEWLEKVMDENDFTEDMFREWMDEDGKS